MSAPLEVVEQISQSGMLDDMSPPLKVSKLS